MKWKARQGRERLAHRHCANVFSKPITMQRSGSLSAPGPDCLHQQAGCGFPGRASSLGMRGQLSVEDSWWKKGFLLKRTSFIFPSVSSHSTVWGQIRSTTFCRIIWHFPSISLNMETEKGSLLLPFSPWRRTGLKGTPPPPPASM